MSRMSLRRHPVKSSVFVATVVVFTLVTAAVLSGLTTAVDDAVLRSIHAISTSWLDNLAIATSDIGGVWVMFGGSLLLAFCLRHQRRDAACIVLAVWGASLTTTIIKQLIARPRPALWPHIVDEVNWSFPSGHATASAAMAAAVVLLAWPTRWRWAVLGIGAVVVVLVGLSRLYLGVHYPSDVLAGWCVGVLWALGCWLFLPSMRTNRG